jgi:phosphate transport system substrate-binding protein
MADIGYAPLPPQLSQFIADAVGRMWGRAPETLTRENCANPRFDPNYLLPGGEQPPPLPDPPGVENLGTAGGSRTTTTGAGGTSTTGDGAAAETAAAGRAGNEDAVGGGSDDWRDVDPVAFDRPGMARIGRWPLLVVLLVLLVPVVGGMIYGTAQQGRLRRAELGASPPPPPTPEPDPPPGD